MVMKKGGHSQRPETAPVHEPPNAQLELGAEVCTVPIESIEYLQLREKTDLAVVKEYAQQMSEGAKFPRPQVIKDGDIFIAWDGIHTIKAVNMTAAEVECDVVVGTRRDALQRALGANAVHGFRRTKGDNRKIVMTAVTDSEWKKLSNNAVAKLCAVSEKLVRNIRDELQLTSDDPKLTVDGRTINTRKIGKHTQNKKATEDEKTVRKLTKLEPHKEGIEGVIENSRVQSQLALKPLLIYAGNLESFDSERAEQIKVSRTTLTFLIEPGQATAMELMEHIKLGINQALKTFSLRETYAHDNAKKGPDFEQGSDSKMSVEDCGPSPGAQPLLANPPHKKGAREVVNGG